LCPDKFPERSLSEEAFYVANSDNGDSSAANKEGVQSKDNTIYNITENLLACF